MEASTCAYRANWSFFLDGIASGVPNRNSKIFFLEESFEN